jgi:hypothetical protein
MDLEATIYRIDEADRIVYTNGAWDEFAIENSSPEVASTKVLNRVIWDFLGDPTVESIYRNILERVREGNHASFVFRCDAPERMRRLRMSISPMPGGLVEFRTDMIETAPRPSIPLLNVDAARPSELLVACGWCSKIRINERWLEVENAVNNLLLFDRMAVPRLSHGICDLCYDEMIGDLIYRKPVPARG